MAKCYERMITEELLKQALLIEKITMKQLGEQLGVHPNTILNYAHKFGIRPGRGRRARKPRATREKRLLHANGIVMLDTFRDDRGTWKARCRCHCSKIFICNYKSIQYNRRKSCGCKVGRKVEKKEIPTNRSYINSYMWNHMRASAKQRDIKWSLTKEFLEDLYRQQDGKCAISGVPIQMATGCSSLGITASLDRKNSRAEYVPSNVQWVHKDINHMKWTLTEEEFLNWCKLVVAHASSAGDEKSPS